MENDVGSLDEYYQGSPVNPPPDEINAGGAAYDVEDAFGAKKLLKYLDLAGELGDAEDYRCDIKDLIPSGLRFIIFLLMGGGLAVHDGAEFSKNKITTWKSAMS